MSMLTSAMGITATSLYAAFGSKEDLFRESVELYNSAEQSPTAAALEEATARDVVEVMLRRNADDMLVEHLQRAEQAPSGETSG
ncbi:hypothetical protein GCM10009676_05210 [Prauserella halophila]|uniref:TetR family transcriptional regulator n=1 Tax=Prauserella halophila TaxID=185641 RepID=A0ABP4GII6_9PSEU|nr:hypothetical protein [Prauserella halophila]